MGQNSVFRKDGIYFTRVNLIPALINCLKEKRKSLLTQEMLKLSELSLLK